MPENLLQYYLSHHDNCSPFQLIFSCQHPIPYIYFIVVMISLVFYMYLGVKVLRTMNFSIKTIPPEFKYCVISTIRQIALYIKINAIYFRAHTKFRTLAYQFHLINVALYYLINALYSLELLRCLKKNRFPFAKGMYWIGMILMWLNVSMLLFDTVLYCFPFDQSRPFFTKLFYVLGEFNDVEYYVQHCFSIIILSIIFVFSQSIQALINEKYRIAMKIMVFAYAFIILFNKIDSFFYGERIVKTLILHYPQEEYSKYIMLIVNWVGEQSVSLIQVIIVYSLTVPNFGYEELTVTDELFNNILSV